MKESNLDCLAVALVSDSNYLSRCAVAIESSGASDSCFVLGLDEGVNLLREYLPGVQVVDKAELIGDSPSLQEALKGRSPSEQIFTMGPAFLLGLSLQFKEDGWLVYADSDLIFFESISQYLASFEAYNVVVAPHRHYFWNRMRLSKFGEFNVGMVAFRNNQEGLKALSFWAESCLAWCSDVAENGKYADQKYLENFHSVASGVHADKSIGSNFAPWNSMFVRLSRDEKGKLLVGGQKLSYFHAQGLKQKSRRWVLGHLNYFALAGPSLKKLIYTPYLQRLEHWGREPGFASFGSSRIASTLVRRLIIQLSYCVSITLGQTVKVNSRKIADSDDSLK